MSLDYCGDCGQPTCAEHRDESRAARCTKCQLRDVPADLLDRARMILVARDYGLTEWYGQQVEAAERGVTAASVLDNDAGNVVEELAAIGISWDVFRGATYYDAAFVAEAKRLMKAAGR